MHHLRKREKERHAKYVFNNDNKKRATCKLYFKLKAETCTRMLMIYYYTSDYLVSATT